MSQVAKANNALIDYKYMRSNNCCCLKIANALYNCILLGDTQN